MLPQLEHQHCPAIVDHQNMMEPTTHPTHPPKDDPFTAEELAKYDGKDENVPVYVAIKGAYPATSACRVRSEVRATTASDRSQPLLS